VGKNQKIENRNAITQSRERDVGTEYAASPSKLMAGRRYQSSSDDFVADGVVDQFGDDADAEKGRDLLVGLAFG
jgi:hypothetical protein